MTQPNRHRSVLFVCMGNICRSPAAEGVLQHLVNQRGFAAEFVIDSAGTIDYHSGELPDARMRSAASRRGVTLASRARQVKRNDFDLFDLIVPMDRSNQRFLLDLQPETAAETRPQQIRLLSEFLDDGQWPIDVPDPYYGEADGFEFVLDMLQAACPNLLEWLRQPDTLDRA